MNTINMYDPTREYMLYKSEIDNAISKVINHGGFINGPEVKELEKSLSEYTNVKHCIAVGNGTDALQIALMALNIGEGDEVITVAHTWISCSEVITLLGAKPVFVDIESTTFNIDPKLIEAKITDKTKAIMVINLYGHLANYDDINKIAYDHCLAIIEDAAQSFGAIQRGKRSCSFGHISTTSFFPTKPLGCYGDGGACFTSSNELAHKMRAIRNHGAVKKFQNECIGINSRLDTIQASVLLAKFNHFSDTLERRNNVANTYYAKLKKLDDLGLILLPTTLSNNYHVWAQFSILIQTNTDRDGIMQLLKEKGVNCSIFYPVPLHYQKCFEYLGYKKGDLPVTESVCERVLSVPCYGELTDIEIDHICNTISSYYGMN